jgi:hypothetical protein
MKLNCVDDSLLNECLLLIRAIAEVWQRKMNVFWNNPMVIGLLATAVESETEP